jgi:hypothetical protein
MTNLPATIETNPKNGMILRAISIGQPHASLMAIGAKLYETRKSNTEWRGWTAIHAASQMSDEERNLALAPGFMDALLPAYSLPPEGDIPHIAIPALNPKLYLPVGCYLSIGILERTHRTEDIKRKISLDEALFGDYSNGRWAFDFACMQRLPTPIPGPDALDVHNSLLETGECAKCGGIAAALALDTEPVKCFVCTHGMYLPHKNAMDRWRT